MSNPFEGGEVIEISERQLRLAKKWNPRSITQKILKDHKVKIDSADEKKYEERKAAAGAWKKGEANLAAEYMFLEGSDSLEDSGWFGEGVYAYPSYPTDDWLRGCDAIIMFTDPDDETKATPLSVDVKTNPEDANERLGVSSSFQVRADHVPPAVYWADTTDSDPDVTTFQDIPPGRIPAVQAIIYLSKEDVQLYRMNRTTEKQSKELLDTVGIEIRKQLQVQLEALALTHFGVSFDRRTGRAHDEWSRKRLKKELEEAIENPKTSFVLRQIAKILPQIWERQKEEAELAFLRSGDPKQLLLWEENIRELFGEEQKKSRLRSNET